MDRRGITATLCTMVGGGGIAAMIGATALPSGSPYFTTLIVLGLLAILTGGGGLIVMLFTAGSTGEARPAQIGFRVDPPPTGLDGRARALWMLQRARENAITARKSWFGTEGHHRAFSELRAAILGVKKEFGIGGLLSMSEDSDQPSYRELLGIYILYVNSFLPLLESGHIEAAGRTASGFSWSRGFD